jgi:hypothetical protein
VIKDKERNIEAELIDLNIREATIIKKYLKYGCIPLSCDELLDIRSKVNAHMLHDKKVPEEWYVREIKAIDYILKKHYS